MAVVLADTSIFIGMEAGRILSTALDELEGAVSVITLGELRWGALMVGSRDPSAMDARIATYDLARRLDPIPIDDEVADAWGLLMSNLRVSGRTMPVNDSWIAATALAHGVPVLSQDADYDDVPGLWALRI